MQITTQSELIDDLTGVWLKNVKLCIRPAINVLANSKLTYSWQSSLIFHTRCTEWSFRICNQILRNAFLTKLALTLQYSNSPAIQKTSTAPLKMWLYFKVALSIANRTYSIFSILYRKNCFVLSCHISV